ncbi:MAG: aminotransferase class I/II-fold pyridoxal phosphate-dependent enzyme [Chitinophagales bacterium]
MIIQEANRLSFIKEYYFSKKLREIKQMMDDGKPVLNLGIGNPDMAPSESTIEALKISASKLTNHGYQPYKGLPELSIAIADFYYKTYGVLLESQSEILPLIGSKEGISHISQAFLNPGDVALVPDPGYPSYSSATRLAGGEPVTYSLDENNDWAPKWDELTDELLDKAKIWWINYPNMPTGAEGSKAIFEKAIALAKKHNILLVNDNPYSLILNKEKPVSIHQANDSKSVALELNSLSKSHNMAGWRIGFLLGGKDYIDAVLKVKSNIDSGMFKPLQEAALEAFKNDEQWHADRNKEYEQRRVLAFEIMDLLDCTYEKDSVGMFVWGKIPERYDDVEMLTEKLLQEANVFITPGFIFGENGKRYIRISLCSKPALLMETIQRIKRLSL